MSDYVLSCCSTIDLSHEWIERRDVACVLFNYELDGEPCKDDFGLTHPPADLYARMLAGASAKTSQVSVGEYAAHFKPFLEAGKDVLHVTLSSGISSTYNSACVARDQLAEEFPNNKVVVVDSLAASSGYGLLMDRLCDLRDGGMGIDELAQWTLDHRLELQHWFFSSDLTFFIRGGRISKASGIMGGLLKICPVMNVAYDGTLQVREKIRTKGKAIKRVIEKMAELAQGGVDYDGKVYICQSECLADATAVADGIYKKFGHINGEIEIFPIGAVIGSHTGPGTIALFFWGSPRKD